MEGLPEDSYEQQTAHLLNDFTVWAYNLQPPHVYLLLCEQQVAPLGDFLATESTKESHSISRELVRQKARVRLCIALNDVKRVLTGNLTSPLGHCLWVSSLEEPAS